MPNWVENILRIEDVSDKRLEEIRSEISGSQSYIDEKTRNPYIYERVIDFRKIDPIPPELEIEDCVLGEKGYKILHKLEAYHEIFYHEPNQNLEERFRKHFEKSSEEDIVKAFELGKQYYKNSYEHGCKTSNDWCIDNWGTKWNSLLCEAISPDEIFFLTAWDPPIPIISLLGVKFKDAKFVLQYSSESDPAGIYTVQGYAFVHDFSENPPDKFDSLRKKMRIMKHKIEKKQSKIF